MPGFDRTGPLGRGPRTGLGQGRCRPRRDETPDAPDLDDTLPLWVRRYGSGGGWQGHLRRRVRRGGPR